MINKNPENRKSISEDHSWHASTEDARIGFIARNSTISQSISTPQGQFPLGRTLVNDFYAAQGGIVLSTKGQIGWNILHPTSSTPGILSIAFDPIFAEWYHSAPIAGQPS